MPQSTSTVSPGAVGSTPFSHGSPRENAPAKARGFTINPKVSTAHEVAQNAVLSSFMISNLAKLPSGPIMGGLAVPVLAATTVKSVVATRHQFTSVYPQALRTAHTEQGHVLAALREQGVSSVQLDSLETLHRQLGAVTEKHELKSMPRRERGLAKKRLKNSPVADRVSAKGVNAAKVAKAFGEKAHALAGDNPSDSVKFSLARERRLGNLGGVRTARNLSALSPVGNLNFTIGTSAATTLGALELAKVGAVAIVPLASAASGTFAVGAGAFAVGASADAARNAKQVSARKKQLQASARLAQDIDPDAMASIRSKLRRDIGWDRSKAIQSSITALASVGVVGGSIASFTPAAPVSLPITAASFFLLVGSTSAHNVVSSKQRRAHGEAAPAIAKQMIAARDPRASVAEHGIHQTARLAGNEFEQQQAHVVKTKLLSLIVHVLKSEFNSETARIAQQVQPQRIAAKRHASVAKAVETGKKNWHTGTTLQNAELAKLQDLFNEQFPVEFFGGPRAEVEQRVAQVLRDDGDGLSRLLALDSEVQTIAMQRADKSIRRHLTDGGSKQLLKTLGYDKKQSVEVNRANMDELTLRIPKAGHIWGSKLLSTTIKASSETGKAMQADTVQRIGDLSAALDTSVFPTAAAFNDRDYMSRVAQASERNAARARDNQTFVTSLEQHYV